MAEVTMYTAQSCGYCQRAELLLNRKGVDDLKKIPIDVEPSQLKGMISRTGRRTVPQIFVGELHIGGFDDLVALDRTGELDELLRNNGQRSNPS